MTPSPRPARHHPPETTTTSDVTRSRRTFMRIEQASTWVMRSPAAVLARSLLRGVCSKAAGCELEIVCLRGSPRRVFSADFGVRRPRPALTSSLGACCDVIALPVLVMGWTVATALGDARPLRAANLTCGLTSSVTSGSPSRGSSSLGGLVGSVDVKVAPTGRIALALAGAPAE